MSKINFTAYFILLLIIFVFMIFFFGLEKNQKYDTRDNVGKQISEFELTSAKSNNILTKGDLDRSNFKLFNFWASWCPPCKDEHPFLMKLNKIDKLKIYGVNFKDDTKSAKKFLIDLGDPYDHLLLDESGKSSVDFGIYGIPESILIDKNLIIIKRYIGPINNKDYEEINSLVTK